MYESVFILLSGLLIFMEYKHQSVEKEINYLLYDEPFTKLQRIMDKNSTEESKELLAFRKFIRLLC